MAASAYLRDRYVLGRPYFTLFGELFLDDVFGTCDDLSSHFGCGRSTWAAPFLTSLMVFFNCIVLMNLLIAMMGQTFSKVYERANEVWSYGRYRLIAETAAMDLLPPPLNLPHLIIRPLMWLCNFRRRKLGQLNDNVCVIWIPSPFLAEMRTAFLEREKTQVEPPASL